VRRVYRTRHRLLTEGLAGEEHLRMMPSSAGLHICLELPDGSPGAAHRIRDAAAVSGVAIDTLDQYCAERPREGLVLGFGAIPAEQIPGGLRLLRAAVRRVAR
jgi:GntR family transcriptional regulator/MocR family aminotransferase